jgi:hypothetical protein
MKCYFCFAYIILDFNEKVYFIFMFFTYLQFNVIKWAKQRSGQNPIDVKSDEAI